MCIRIHFQYKELALKSHTSKQTLWITLTGLEIKKSHCSGSTWWFTKQGTRQIYYLWIEGSGVPPQSTDAFWYPSFLWSVMNNVAIMNKHGWQKSMSCLAIHCGKHGWYVSLRGPYDIKNTLPFYKPPNFPWQNCIKQCFSIYLCKPFMSSSVEMKAWKLHQWYLAQKAGWQCRLGEIL
jgi:hypothetical protein